MFTPRETWQFDTERIGRRVLVYDALDSTNTRGAALAGTEPDADGLVLIAEHQSAGRGQYGRVWQSRPGSSLLMSVVLRPPAEVRRPVILTAWAAVSVAEAILTLTGTQARIKWPNDLLIRGKKVCGILIEQTGTPRGTVTTVVGIGLNLNQTADEFAGANLPDASSLGVVSGRAIDVRTAAEVVIRKLDLEYARLATERVAVEADWKWRVGLLGRHVVIEHPDGATTTGRLRDMAFDGLDVETGDGFVRVIAPESVARIRPQS